MKRTLTLLAALILLTTGCSKHVEPPPDADSIETLRTFLDAIITDDEKTGKQIAGSCWISVQVS